MITCCVWKGRRGRLEGEDGENSERERESERERAEQEMKLKDNFALNGDIATMLAP